MIELKHVSKRFDDKTYVLKDINLTFPRYGIVIIYGPSGCGKTTLLNVISSLYDFEGEISFNGKKYSRMNDEDRGLLRNGKMGFIFQDYKLFEFETVRNNIYLAIDLKTSDKKSHKDRRVNDLLMAVGLQSKADELVSKLSGGEKQRVAIARAISNAPSLILADEPTGNLDTKNSEMVMDLFEKISMNSLIVMVSHDEELTKKYADQIIYMNDGEIKKIEYNNHNHHVDLLPLLHLKPKENKPALPLSFCLKHTLNNIKKRKWRTSFVFLSTSLGLICVGLGTVLSNIISTNLYKSYSSIIDSNKVVITPKEQNNSVKKEIKAYDYDEVDELFDKYKEDISRVGIYYWNNFEMMFTSYSLSIYSDDKINTLPNYTLGLFNEFDDTNTVSTIIYPNQVTEIEDDEVVLGLTYPTLNDICFAFTIKRNVESLSNFLKENDVYIDVDITNVYWSYHVSFPIKVKGFTMSNNNSLFHSNPLWNEFIFEEKCGLSNTNLINVNSKNPWDVKKSYYLEFKKNRDSFLTDIKFSKQYQDVITEILDEKYYPTLNKNKECFECNRIAILTQDNVGGINGFYNSYIKKASKDINSLIYGCKNGYTIYPDSLMMGFSRSTFFSNNLDYIDEAIDLNAYLKYEESMYSSLPDEVIEGHFAKSNTQGLLFNPDYNLLEGRQPMSYDEIVISKPILNRLKVDDPINKPIYISFPVIEELLPNGYLYRDYHTVGLKIVGISDSNKFEISNTEEWSIMFFQTHLGMSIFNLEIDSIAADINEDKEELVMTSLQRAFPKFSVVSPISNVKESIKTVCGYIETILIILSISSVIISSLLLSICNYLHFVEIQKDIGLMRCIGITKNESSKFIFVHSLFFGFISALIATAQLLFVCYILSQSISSLFVIESTFIFNPLAVIYMFSLSLTVAFISSLIIKKKVNRLNPLDCLRS